MREAVGEFEELAEQMALDRERSRSAVVQRVRTVEAERENLYRFIAKHGPEVPDADGILARLRQHSSELAQLQAELAKLEEPIRRKRRVRVDPEIAVEVMRETILAATEKKKRAFMGAFIEKLVFDATGVAVDYRPEALLNSDPVTSVRSANCWLPDLGSNQGPTD